MKKYKKKAPLAAPEIIRVVDSRNTPLNNPDTTSDKNLTFSGTGTPAQVVYIYDDFGSFGSASVSAKRSWIIPLTAELGTHRFVARVAGEGDSQPWVITILNAVTAPTISRIEDSTGALIADGGQTFDKNVKLYGRAQADGMVEIYDQNVVVGAATADTNGYWDRSLADLAVRLHTMKAKALYVDNPESPLYSFTVQQLSPPPPDVLEDNAANVLDLKGLAKITVRVPNYGMQLSDTVLVRWAGTVSHDTAVKPVTVTAPMDFDIPLSWAEADIDKGPVRITYSYGRGGNPVVVSQYLPVAVIKSGTALDLIKPQVVEATGVDRDQLDFSRLADGADVHVRVNYTGMDLGQTVRVRWMGRIEFVTAIKTVTTIAPIDFVIWRDEVIDSIGRLVDVNYSVVETPGGVLLPSKILNLNVLPQAFDLVAPTINGNHSTVYVAYVGSLTTHTIAVRWRGVTDRNTGVQRPPTNGGTTQFTIPSSWVTENRGRRVLVNYSVGVGNNPLIFSQLLRIDIP